MAKTKPDKLFSLFEDLAEKMNINIVQGKGDFQGGMCSVNSESYIVLNKLKPVDQRPVSYTHLTLPTKRIV